LTNKTLAKADVVFPIRLLDGILGETLSIDNRKAILDLEKLPSSFISILSIRLPNLPVSEILTIEIELTSSEIKKHRTYCEVNVLEKQGDWPLILRDAISKYQSLDKEFVDLTKDLRDFLQGVKSKFDEFDTSNFDEQMQIEFVRANKKVIFARLDSHFDQIWKIAENFDKESYRLHKVYYQQMLYDLLGANIEINSYIYQKPLGYPGDYVMMNYIYDYCGDKAFLGRSSYEKLINNYTCSVPFSCSNIERKDFIKARILEVAKRKDNARILSVGCGSARELTELLAKEEFRRPISFICLDFEKKALEYVRARINEINKHRQNLATLQYIHRNLIDIAVDKSIEERINSQDLIYVFGVFDYLGDHFCSRIIRQLYSLLNSRGSLIICNASAENYSHRAYYEMLGGWNMVHRTKEEIMTWVKGIENAREVKLEESQGYKNYLFLTVTKI